MSKAFLAQLPVIGASTTLGWPNDDIAQSYMEHILQRARVLLPNRGWRVGLIKEFYPRGASLLGLNVNAGSEVCIRFRVPGNKHEFLPFHEVLCTALHEFTHCIHARHDRSFWNLYYDLVKECEALEVSMIEAGKPLYPKMSYSSRDFHAGPPAGNGGGAFYTRAAVANSGPHHAGGALALRGGRGRGRRPANGSRTRTSTLTTTSTRRPMPRAAPPPATERFPGAGQRLGGMDPIVAREASSSTTLLYDALSPIQAAAAERRLLQSHLFGKEKVNQDSPCSTKVETLGGMRESEPGPEDAEDALPDAVPQSTLHESDSSCWRCHRCGFQNQIGVIDCVFCTDEADATLVRGALPLEEALCAQTAPVQKKQRCEEKSGLGRTDPSLSKEHQGTSKEDAYVLSDDDDNR